MPRIRTSQSEPIDFCRDHFPGMKKGAVMYQNDEGGPDGRGDCYVWKDEHPPYEGENYRCEVCDKFLTSEDD